MPGKAAFVLEFDLQIIRERFEVTRVIAGIIFHALGEGTPRPIGFLWTFLQFHAQMFLDE